MKKTLFVALMVFAGIAHSAILKKQETVMSFGACVTAVQNMTKLVPAKVIVATDIVTVVRFLTAEGSMVVTCSKPDGKMLSLSTNNPF